MPDQLKTARVTGATLGSELPARIGELEAALSAITGIPLDVLINAPMHEVVAAGLRKSLFQDLAGDPTAIGELARNAANLKWHDGLGARSLWHTGNQLPKRKTTNETINNSITLQNDEELKFDGVNLVPAGFYEFEMQVYYQSSPAAGFKMRLSVPSDATGVWTCLFNNTSVVPTAPLFKILVTVQTELTLPTDGTIQATWIKGTLNYPTIGVLNFQWAQTALDASGTGVISGSTLCLRRLS